MNFTLLKVSCATFYIGLNVQMLNLATICSWWNTYTWTSPQLVQCLGLFLFPLITFPKVILTWMQNHSAVSCCTVSIYPSPPQRRIDRVWWGWILYGNYTLFADEFSPSFEWHLNNKRLLSAFFSRHSDWASNRFDRRVDLGECVHRAGDTRVKQTFSLTVIMLIAAKR